MNRRDSDRAGFYSHNTDNALIKAVQAVGGLATKTLKQYAYSLTTPQPFTVHGLPLGTMERIDHRGRRNGLRIRYGDGRRIDFPSAVDISEQLETPRVLL